MKKFTGFIKKEFIHIFRDVRTMLILFGMPVVQVLLFGYVITTEVKNVYVTIHDPSKDPASSEITDKLLSSGYFIMENESSGEQQIAEAFRKGKIKESIVFEPNFARNLEREQEASIQIIADASDPNIASLVINYSKAIILDYIRNNTGYKLFPMQIKPSIRMYFNPELKGVFMFVPGIIAMILMLISAMMTSISITREKETGTMETLLVSPLNPYHIVIGKVTPYIILSFINLVSIIILSIFVFGIPIQGNIILLLCESILFIILALSLGILISIISPNQQVAMFISMVALMLPTILLSGFIFPIDNMPTILQWFSLIMPPRWFIVILKNIMLKGTGFAFVWKETLILLGMTITFIMISVKKFKIHLE